VFPITSLRLRALFAIKCWTFKAFWFLFIEFIEFDSEGDGEWDGETRVSSVPSINTFPILSQLFLLLVIPSLSGSS
jgi:hypothetical protein